MAPYFQDTAMDDEFIVARDPEIETDSNQPSHQKLLPR
jgi:hypothetical protein